MNRTIHRAVDPDLRAVEFGAVYAAHAPRSGEPWFLYKIADGCGVESVEPLEVPDGWDDAYEYAIADEPIWSYIACLAGDADLAHADLEIAIVPLVDEGSVTESCALLHRFVWSY